MGSVEQGVFMQANRSWSIDDYRNKFQFGCEYGTADRERQAHPHRPKPQLSRRLRHVLAQSVQGRETLDTFRVFGTPNCGKGEPNQDRHVGHASPVCAFRGRRGIRRSGMSAKKDLEARFDRACDLLLGRLAADEALSLEYSAEDSVFLRFNRGLVRQIGSVLNAQASFKYYRGGRTLFSAVNLTGSSRGGRGPSGRCPGSRPR